MSNIKEKSYFISDNREIAPKYQRVLLIESDSLPARIFNNFIGIILSIIFVILILYYIMCVLAVLPGTLGSLYLGMLYANIISGGTFTIVIFWLIHAVIGISIFPLLGDTETY